jgi:hypothetical protein
LDPLLGHSRTRFSFSCADFISTATTIASNYKPNFPKTIGIFSAIIFIRPRSNATILNRDPEQILLDGVDPSDANDESSKDVNPLVFPPPCAASPYGCTILCYDFHIAICLMYLLY